MLFQLRDCSVDVARYNVAAVEQADGHVLPVPRVALDHLVAGLEAGRRDFLDRALLMKSLFGGNDRRVGDEGEVDAGVGYEVVLELAEVDVEGSFEPERGRDGGDGLRDDPVQVGVGWSVDLHVLQADLVNGLVVNLEPF